MLTKKNHENEKRKRKKIVGHLISHLSFWVGLHFDFFSSNFSDCRPLIVKGDFKIFCFEQLHVKPVSRTITKNEKLSR